MHFRMPRCVHRGGVFRKGDLLGELRDPIPVKPVCAVLRSPGISVSEILDRLETLLGPVESRSPEFSFDYTSYYLKEMGGDLRKQFVSFQRLMHPAGLPVLKVQTNRLEAEWSESGKRRVNLDPGYVTSAKLVLASTKNFAHRVYLDECIYGDVQLRFTRGGFCVSEWTYPDYQTASALEFFSKVRERFNAQDKIL